MLKNELLLNQEEADKLQTILGGKEEQLEEKHQLLASKSANITSLENSLHESKEQNELLNISLADNKNQLTALQEKLFYEQQKNQAIEQNLCTHKQLLLRLYNDLSSFVNEENEQSPVIALRPGYVSSSNEEIAVQ